MNIEKPFDIYQAVSKHQTNWTGIKKSLQYVLFANRDEKKKRWYILQNFHQYD